MDALHCCTSVQVEQLPLLYWETVFALHWELVAPLEVLPKQQSSFRFLWVPQCKNTAMRAVDPVLEAYRLIVGDRHLPAGILLTLIMRTTRLFHQSEAKQTNVFLFDDESPAK